MAVAHGTRCLGGEEPFRKSGTSLEFSSSDCIGGGSQPSPSSHFSAQASPKGETMSREAAPPSAPRSPSTIIGGASDCVPAAGSALLRAAKAGRVGMFAQFGGQGADYLDELRAAYEAAAAAPATAKQGVNNNANAVALVINAASALREEAAVAIARAETESSGALRNVRRVLRYGFDVMRWLQAGAGEDDSGDTHTDVASGGQNVLSGAAMQSTASPAVTQSCAAAAGMADADADAANGTCISGAGGNKSTGAGDGEADAPPPLSYLRSAPVSYPLIALTQLVNYVVALGAMGTSQNEMVSLLRGATGHSQGIASAVAVAWSEDESALLRKAVLVIRYLFWHGLRMQLVYDGEMASRRHERAADSDRITPMLAVVGLQPAQLQQHVDAVNAELRAAGTTDQKSQIDGLIELALVNGSVACTVCGLPRGLLALHARLSRTHAVGASAAATQRTLPYYKRLPRLSALRWLSVTAPFHYSALMEPARVAILQDARRIGFHVPASELRCAVFGTAGVAADLRQIELGGGFSTNAGEGFASAVRGAHDDEDVVAALVRMQAVQAVAWPRALRAASRSRGVTHILDFGPGGASGAASFTARIMQERRQAGEGEVHTVLAAVTCTQASDTSGGRPKLLGMHQLTHHEDTAIHVGDAGDGRRAPIHDLGGTPVVGDDGGSTNVVSMALENIGDDSLANFADGFVTVVTDI